MSGKTAKPAEKKRTTAKQATRKPGRPSLFDGIDMELVEFLVKKGFTDEEMATACKVTKQTWGNWKKAHPEFFASLKDWKQEADEAVERSLYERATGYQHPEDKIFNADGAPLIVPTIKHYPPDSTAMIFWLKNRKPKEWRDQPPDGDVAEDLKILMAMAAKEAAEMI